MGALFQIAGHGLVSDMVLTGRVVSAEEALAHGIVSRVVPPDELDTTVREMAEQIAAAPAATVRMARSIIRHLALPQLRASMDEEMIGQTYLSRSDDMAELRASRADDRPPHYTGS
jgi:enoyl-CoA hydratase/carnithine racemase